MVASDLHYIRRTDGGRLSFSHGTGIGDFDKISEQLHSKSG